MCATYSVLSTPAYTAYCIFHIRYVQSNCVLVQGCRIGSMSFYLRAVPVRQKTEGFIVYPGVTLAPLFYGWALIDRTDGA